MTKNIIHGMRLIFAAMILAGCAHGPRCDLNAAMSDLVLQMKEDAKFKQCYASMTTNKVPVLQIGNIVNRTEHRVTQDLESARDHLKVALWSAGLFDIVDDAASGESISRDLAETLVLNVDAGLKSNECLKYLRDSVHASADCQMYGVFRESPTGSRHDFEISLEFIDLKTGKLVWFGIAEVNMRKAERNKNRP